ncbi:MAG TPA: hypothetical protein VMU10_07825 [Desulfomonilia bacterium]|nr:hypothetical protein [Desulfomonilia bacterium]
MLCKQYKKEAFLENHPLTLTQISAGQQKWIYFTFARRARGIEIPSPRVNGERARVRGILSPLAPVSGERARVRGNFIKAF